MVRPLSWGTSCGRPGEPLSSSEGWMVLETRSLHMQVLLLELYLHLVHSSWSQWRPLTGSSLHIANSVTCYKRLAPGLPPPEAETGTLPPDSTVHPVPSTMPQSSDQEHMLTPRISLSKEQRLRLMKCPLPPGHCHPVSLFQSTLKSPKWCCQ